MADTSSVPSLDVRGHRGAPCIHINGKPHCGVAFWHIPGERGVEEWRLFGRSGIHLFQLDLGLWPGEKDAADPNEAWDRTLQITLDADPEARFWIRLGMEPPEWWLQQYPDEAQVHHDQSNDDRFQWRVAFSGPQWQKQTADRLARFIGAMEQRWGERVWCYQLNAGDCGEWAYSWRGVLSGYAPAQTQAWRAWLAEKYGNENGLRTAWGDKTVTFEGAQPPGRAGRVRGRAWPPASHLIDPATERPLVDWLHFHGHAQAAALARLAGDARVALRALGRRKLIAAFHGYHFFPYGAAYGPCNAGFSDLTPVLESPDLDVLCTPLAYIHRDPGGVYSHHDVAVHGKAFFTEDDTFTHRATFTPWRYCCRDATETLRILQRNLAGVLAEGGSQWWMDHDSQRWYCDEQLEAGIGVMRRLAEGALSSDRGRCAQVVYVTNEASFRILRQDDGLIDQLWPKQQIELLRLGAPVEFVRVKDLAAAEARGDAARWKLVIVGGCLWLDAAERALLQRVLLGGNRHVLFVHGQGICDGQRLDPGFTSALMGINVRAYSHGGPCRGQTSINGEHFAWGTDKEIAPILYADDPAAHTFGWLERQYQPALVRRVHADWTALWSAVPGVPWKLLGSFAEAAGVHRYATDGSQVMANNGLLAIHAAGDGARTLRLPRSRRWIDALSGEDLGAHREMSVDLQRGENRIWHLDEA